MSEITGPRSTGRGSVVQAALAALTRQEGLGALIDPLDMFDPASAADAGIVLDRVLWVRGEAVSGGRADVVLERGVKALNLVLQAGGFDLVVFDLAEAPHDAIRRLPFTTWFRLQRAIEGSRTACVLTGRGPIARSAGGVSIQLARRTDMQNAKCRMQNAGPPAQDLERPDARRLRGAGTVWAGRGGASLFAGLDIQARIVRARDPEPGRIDIRIPALRRS